MFNVVFLLMIALIAGIKNLDVLIVIAVLTGGCNGFGWIIDGCAQEGGGGTRAGGGGGINATGGCQLV